MLKMGSLNEPSPLTSNLAHDQESFEFESESVGHPVLTLCNSVDCSPPSSFVYGILQAQILEWVATSFSKRSPRPGD